MTADGCDGFRDDGNILKSVVIVILNVLILRITELCTLKGYILYDM